MEEPDMAAKQAQAPMLAIASPRQKTKPAIGRLIKVKPHPGVIGKLSHENKQRDDRQGIRGRRLIGHHASMEIRPER